MSLYVKLSTLIALALFSLPVSAQPTSGPSAPDPPSASTASAVLDASLDAVVHYGTAVLLWDALPAADGYVVEVAAPGAPLVEAAYVALDAASDATGYSAQIELPDGQYAVRLVALGTDAVTATRDLTVESPQRPRRDDRSRSDSLLATN